jgi:hypothetical protein
LFSQIQRLAYRSKGDIWKSRPGRWDVMRKELFA